MSKHSRSVSLMSGSVDERPTFNDTINTLGSNARFLCECVSLRKNFQTSENHRVRN